MTVSDPGAGQQQGRDQDLVDSAAKVIVRAKQREHTAPFHWALALHQAGMLTAPGGCSQAPHPGVEFYGPTGGCAECGYRPPAPSRQCCVSRIGQRHAWGCTAMSEALSADATPAPSSTPPARDSGRDPVIDAWTRLGDGDPVHVSELVPDAFGLDEPLHEVECPSCGATIRARMADAPEIGGRDEAREAVARLESLPESWDQMADAARIMADYSAACTWEDAAVELRQLLALPELDKLLRRPA